MRDATILPTGVAWATGAAMEWTEALKVIVVVTVPYGAVIGWLALKLDQAQKREEAWQAEVRRLNAAWHSESDAAGKELAKVTLALTAATDKLADLHAAEGK